MSVPGMGCFSQPLSEEGCEGACKSFICFWKITWDTRKLNCSSQFLETAVHAAVGALPNSHSPKEPSNQIWWPEAGYLSQSWSLPVPCTLQEPGLEIPVSASLDWPRGGQRPNTAQSDGEEGLLAHKCREGLLFLWMGIGSIRWYRAAILWLWGMRGERAAGRGERHEEVRALLTQNHPALNLTYNHLNYLPDIELGFLPVAVGSIPPG